MEPLTIINFVLSLAALGASITAYRANRRHGAPLEDPSPGGTSAISRPRGVGSQLSYEELSLRSAHEGQRRNERLSIAPNSPLAASAFGLDSDGTR